MLENGFIKLHRSLLKWEWYDDINTKCLFLHLLLTVNYQEEKWHGVTIKRGQRISSYAKLSEELGLSRQNIRTAISHLVTTGELTHETTSKYGMFTVINYDKYQSLTHDQHTYQQSANTELTPDQQQRKKANKPNNEKENKKSFTPPTFQEIESYCFERKNNIDPQRFFDYFEASGWVDSKGNKVKNWKQKIITWENKNNGTNINNASKLPTGDFREAKPKYGNVV